MSYDQPTNDSFLQLDPEPDDEAWESYLEFVMPMLDSVDANGLDAAALARLEEALGHQVPYEVGLLLTIGVPDGDLWWTWKDDPVRQLARFRADADVEADLLPLYGRCAIALGVGDGVETDARNPVLRLDGAQSTMVGSDLAAWLHAEFNLPLPMWPAPAPRSFPYWSDLGLV